MMAITHAAISTAGVSLLLGTANPLPLALAVLGSQLPDVDTTTSVIGQIAFPVSSWIEDHYPHRSVTHSGLWPRLVRNWAIRLKAIPSLGYKPQNQAGSEKVLTNRQSVS